MPWGRNSLTDWLILSPTPQIITKPPPNFKIVLIPTIFPRYFPNCEQILEEIRSNFFGPTSTTAVVVVSKFEISKVPVFVRRPQSRLNEWSTAVYYIQRIRKTWNWNQARAQGAVINDKQTHIRVYVLRMTDRRRQTDIKTTIARSSVWCICVKENNSHRAKTLVQLGGRYLMRPTVCCASPTSYTAAAVSLSLVAGWWGCVILAWYTSASYNKNTTACNSYTIEKRYSSSEPWLTCDDQSATTDDRPICDRENTAAENDNTKLQHKTLITYLSHYCWLSNSL